MGMNSTEVSYGFGQLGSVYQNLAKPVYPPKDHVIVAIQFVANNVLTALHTETLDSMSPQYITTEANELASAGGPDANYLGVYEAAASAGTAAGVITIADVAGNTLIKPGQVILIGDDSDTINTGFAIDTAAGHITPIYQGPNRQYLEVVSLTGGTYGNTLTVKGVGSGGVTAQAALANIDSSNTIYFLDSYHAGGGTTTVGTSYPTGMVIYGRWTMVTPSEDATGGIICYFGK